MKKLFIAAVLISGLSFGQFFEQSGSDEEPGFFSDENTGPVFGQNPGDYNGNPPEQGEDAGPGNPGPMLPIDDWIWLLPAAGIALGYRLLRPSKEETAL